MRAKKVLGFLVTFLYILLMSFTVFAATYLFSNSSGGPMSQKTDVSESRIEVSDSGCVTVRLENSRDSDYVWKYGISNENILVENRDCEDQDQPGVFSFKPAFSGFGKVRVTLNCIRNFADAPISKQVIDLYVSEDYKVSLLN